MRALGPFMPCPYHSSILALVERVDIFYVSPSPINFNFIAAAHSATRNPWTRREQK